MAKDKESKDKVKEEKEKEKERLREEKEKEKERLKEEKEREKEEKERLKEEKKRRKEEKLRDKSKDKGEGGEGREGEEEEEVQIQGLNDNDNDDDLDTSPPPQERKLAARKSIFFKLFPTREVRSTTLADVIRQLDEEEKKTEEEEKLEQRAKEELDFLDFLKEEVDVNRSLSGSLLLAKRKSEIIDAEKSFSWLRRGSQSPKKRDSFSSDNLSSSPVEPSPPVSPLIPRTDYTLDRPRYGSVSDPHLPRLIKAESSGQHSLPSSPRGPPPETFSTPTEETAPAPQPEKKEKTARELVLEQRAAIAEKRGRFLKLLKEQAEKGIKTRDFAYSPQDPKHWGERDPGRTGATKTGGAEGAEALPRPGSLILNTATS